MHVQSQDQDIKCHMSWSIFMCNYLSFEVVVRFADIGGSLYDHCLNYLSISGLKVYI